MKAAKIGIEDVKFSDRISYLSDDLLFRILSLVPITDAVNTSILSKRWTSVWKMMPMLVYDANSCPSRSFLNFFRRSLELHETPVLQTLTLKLKLRDRSDSLQLPSSFPKTVFQNLVVLKLHTMVCHGFTDKSSVCFRSLKSLNLTFVSFLDQESFCMLMSACPVLDDLYLDSVAIRLSSLLPACDSLFTISIPSLERLEIKDYTPVQSHQSHESRFKINAPSLKYLKINYNSFGRFEISSAMPNLVEATLRVDPSQTDKPLIFLTPVKFLSIHLYVTEVPLLADKISQRLLRLELCIYGKISRNLLLHLLKHSPKLQVLKLREIRYSTQVLNKSPRVLEFKDPPLSFPDPSSVPECLSFHLTTFEWRCYRGTEEEKEFIIYILQNAACLQTAVISVYSEGRRFGEKELLWIKELESVPKASTSCQLVIRLTSRVNLPRISVVDLPRKLHFM